MLVRTHDGAFHADEILAIAILRLIDPSCQVVRTRQPNADVRFDMHIDVGGVDDSEKGLFDHHQQGGAGQRYGVPYASAGLVWKKYGGEVIKSVSPGIEPRDAAIAVDKILVQPVDAIDNGLNRNPHPDAAPFMHLSAAIATLNESGAFDMALDFMTALLHATILRVQHTTEDSEALHACLKSQKSSGILYLPRFLRGWPREVEQDRHASFKLVVWPDAGKWHAQAVKGRAQFPEAWAGLSGTALLNASGIDKLTFCHNGRWYTVGETQQAVVEACKEVFHLEVLEATVRKTQTETDSAPAPTRAGAQLVEVS